MHTPIFFGRKGGVVVTQTPSNAHTRAHQHTHSCVSGYTQIYCALSPGGVGFHLGQRGEYQPQTTCGRLVTPSRRVHSCAQTHTLVCVCGEPTTVHYVCTACRLPTSPPGTLTWRIRGGAELRVHTRVQGVICIFRSLTRYLHIFPLSC